MNQRAYRINIWIVLFLCLGALGLLSCSDSEKDKGTNPILAPSGAEMLGLVNGRSLDYLQIDTTITWVPSYQVSEDTSGHIVRISGSGNEWIITDDSTDMLNVLISDPYVSINGYWRKIGDNPTLVFFLTPAIIYNRSIEPGGSWDGYTPVYTTDTGAASFPFHFAYFGFYFTRTYAGQAQVLTPAFVGSAYRFDTELFVNETDTEPLVVVSEYYAVGIGLVRSEFRAPGLIRIRSLRSHS